MFEPLKKLARTLGLNGGSAGEDPDSGACGISCEEALEQLFEYLDGELEGESREQVARHFEVCRRCYPRLRFERSFMEAVQRVERGEHAPAGLRNRILEVLDEEGLEPE